MNKNSLDFSTLDYKEGLKKLQTTEKGLTQDEAVRRLKSNGYNEIADKKSTSILLIFLKQFKSFLILIHLTYFFYLV